MNHGGRCDESVERSWAGATPSSGGDELGVCARDRDIDSQGLKAVLDLGENDEACRPVCDASGEKHPETEFRERHYGDSRVSWWAGHFGRLGPNQERGV